MRANRMMVGALLVSLMAGCGGGGEDTWPSGDEGGGGGGGGGGSGGSMETTASGGGAPVTRALDPILYNTVDDAFGVGMATVLPDEEHVQVLDLPHGTTLLSVEAYHDRFDTGEMPEMRVGAHVARRDLLTGEVSIVGAPKQDPAVAVAEYEEHHGFTVEVNEVMDRSHNDYYIRFNGEGGYDAAGTTWYGCTATFLEP